MGQDNHKLTAWTAFLNALSHVASRLIWTIVGVIVLAALGRYLFFQAQMATHTERRAGGDIAIREPIPWDDIDAEVVQSMRAAREAAAAYANTSLLAWSSELETRIDDDFLNWYFNYWQQQWLGLKSLGYWIADRDMIENVIGEQPHMTERITASIQAEFAKRVLRPEIAQMQLERIAAETVNVYVAQLQQHLGAIPKKYKLSQHDWQRYLADIAVLTSMSEGTRDLPLTLKTLTATSAIGGTVAAVKMASWLKPMMAKMGTKMTTSAASKGAGRAAARMAAKTGGKVGAKVGGKLLGPIIGVGVLIWDVWDHQHVKAVEKPILRQNLMDYLAELRYSLLYEPQTGLMTMIDGLQANMLSSLKSHPSTDQQARPTPRLREGARAA